ncbi:root phototropism protein 3 [Phoenix dactylifera]|uniref:Root phototropism protein 3 n=1 Tax=Phoenix dactylifera TaxID=42345 RepID=A0A8B7C5F7_PHODC|nr:root phototropism protein 3 [Phoenix dactylifera]
MIAFTYPLVNDADIRAALTSPLSSASSAASHPIPSSGGAPRKTSTLLNPNGETMRSPPSRSRSPNSSFHHKGRLPLPASDLSPAEPWLDDVGTFDADQLARTLAGIKAKGLRPDLLGSIISRYASRWLPELATGRAADPSPATESPTAAWLQKRFLVETLVSVLPPERDAVPCDFLLRLLRTASMAGAEAGCISELEARAGRQLDQATLREVMIPAFTHTCGTLLDVGLMLRLVKRFLGAEEGPAVVARSGAAGLAKVAKLADAYLAEAALDAGLTVAEFEELARAVPGYARATDDGLYRAIDTYIKAHPNAGKQERKALCRLIDARKLSSEASVHAAQNERLPVRSVIQVLFSEHSKLNRISEGSWSFAGLRSPNPALEPPLRVPSKREVLAQQHEVRKLREDVARLQVQCHALQAQVDRLSLEKRKKGFFRWSSLLFRSADVVEKVEDYEVGAERRTPMDAKKGRLAQEKGTPPKWRNSMS